MPLGIDIGATRVRVVHAEQTVYGPRIRGVAVREVMRTSTFGEPTHAEYLAALIEDALAELRTRERRCVCAIGEPDALLRSLSLPKMTSIERERAARFEAQRLVDYPVAEAVVRIHPLDATGGVWALGVARSSAIVTKNATMRAARLKVLAIDHEACALSRALPGFDAIADIGHQRTSLHVMTGHTPVTLQAYNGGADVTQAIERDLSLDSQTAEKRKRILGTAGAGERARAALTSDIAGLIQSARSSHLIRRIALVGNSSRLAGLSGDLEAATGALCELPVSDVLRCGEYPEDVIRSSAPDWTLAAGLALWSAN